MLKRYQSAKYDPTLRVSIRLDPDSSSATAAAPPVEERAIEVEGEVLKSNQRKAAIDETEIR